MPFMPFIKKRRWEDDRKKVFFSQLFRPKAFDKDLPQKVFYGVFELPLLRNAQKRHKQNLKIKKKKLPTPFGGHLPDIRGKNDSADTMPLEYSSAQ
jgi:hypothetical protein